MGGIEAFTLPPSLPPSSPVDKLSSHRFLDADGHRIKEKLKGIGGKLAFHGREIEAERLLLLGQAVLEVRGEGGREGGRGGGME